MVILNALNYLNINEETLATGTPSSEAYRRRCAVALLPDTPALPKKHRDDVAGGARENRHPIREEHPPERDGGRQSGKSF